MAGEPKSLDMDEPLAQRIERHRFDRMIMLSDGVFSIAITLLALELRPPERWSGSWTELVDGRWRAMVGFIVGFVIVGAFWLAHRELFARLRRIDMPGTFLSLLILLLVSLAPAVAALLAAFGPGKAMPAYVALVAAISLAQALLWGWAAFGAALADASIGRTGRAMLLVRFLLPGLLAAILVATWRDGVRPEVALVLVLLLPGVILLRRLAERY